MRRPLEPNAILAALLAEFGRSLIAVSEIMERAMLKTSTPKDLDDYVGKSMSMGGVPDGKSTLADYGRTLDLDLGPEPENPFKKSRESNPTPLPKEDKESSPKMRRAILIALAQTGLKSMTPEQIGIYSGKAHKGGAFLRALGDLKAEGRVDGLIGGKLLRITELGFEELGDWARLPEGMALFEHWCSKLGEMAELILRCLLAETEALTIEQIGERIDRAHKGGAFLRALGQLRKMQLIAPWMTRGTYQLSAELRRAVAPSVRVFDTATGHHHRVDAHKGHAR